MTEKAKYIDVKELSIILDIMKNPDSEFATDDYIDGFSDGISAAIKELEAFPTADVEPVRHGHWVSEYDCGYITPHCSECGETALTKEETSYDYVYSSYCPRCGAKLDKTE